MGKKRTTGFASHLRALREKAGLTQLQLAERAGMHLRGITKLEQGDREPAWVTVLTLSKALGVSCEEFAQGWIPEEADAESEAASDKPRPLGRPRKAKSAEPPSTPRRPPKPARKSKGK